MCSFLPSVHAACSSRRSLRSGGLARRWHSVSLARRVRRTTFMLRAWFDLRLLVRHRTVRPAGLEQSSCSGPALLSCLLSLSFSRVKCASSPGLACPRGASAIRPVWRRASSSGASSHPRAALPGSSSAASPFRPLVSGSQINAWPNTSVKASPNGGPPGLERWYSVHFQRSRPGVPPSVPPYLER